MLVQIDEYKHVKQPGNNYQLFKIKLDRSNGEQITRFLFKVLIFLYKMT